jgi:hypothetical protein
MVLKSGAYSVPVLGCSQLLFGRVALVGPPPNFCPPWPPQQEKHGHNCHGQVQGESYYESGGEN